MMWPFPEAALRRGHVVFIVPATDTRRGGLSGGRVSSRAAAAGDGRPPKDWHVMNRGRDNKGGKLNPDEAGPIAATVFRNPL